MSPCLSLTTYRVTIASTGEEFQVAEGETILGAALRQRVAIPYGCRMGRCSSCKHRVVDGDVDLGDASNAALLEHEREEGLALLCCARPLSDVVLELDGVEGLVSDPPLEVVERAGVLESVVPVTPSLRQVRIGVGSPPPFEFRPGQYVDVRLPAGDWRQYSLTQPPSDTGVVELLVKVLPNGVFSGRLDDLLPGTSVDVRGPYGTMYLREGDSDVLLVGAGSGIAPMMGIIRYAAEARLDRPIRFVCGARHRAELPFFEELTRLTGELRCFEFIPSLSQPEPGDDWTGAGGRLPLIVARTVGVDVADLEAYIAGPPPMCEAVQSLLEAKGMGSRRIHTDAFYAAV